MKKLPCFLLAAAILAILPSPGTSQNQEPVRTGVVLPLSGTLAQYGESERKGAELASEEINKAGGIGGRPIELVFEDNSFSAASQLSAVKQLINIRHVDALLTSWTPMTMPVIPTITEAKLPTFSWMIYASKSSPWLFNMLTDFAPGIRKTVQYACARSIRKAAYITVESSEAEPVDKVLLEESRKCGIETAVQKYEMNSTDFKTFLLKAKTSSPQALFLFAFPHQFPVILRQASQLGMDRLQLFDLGACSPDQIISKGLEPIFEKMRAVSVWYSLNPKLPATKTFIDSYTSRYGERPMPYAAISYDSIHLFARAFEGCAAPADRRECVRENLLKAGEVSAAGGQGRMDEYGNLHLDMEVVEYRDGEFTFVE